MHIVNFVPFDRYTLDKSWEWLNIPEIKYLTQTPDFTRDEQYIWFEDLPNRSDYYIRAIDVDNRIVGVLGLKRITAVDGEVWVYIGVKSMWGKKIGEKCIEHIISYSKNINLDSVYGILLNENLRSKKLLIKLGFMFERELDKYKVMYRLFL